VGTRNVTRGHGLRARRGVALVLCLGSGLAWAADDAATAPAAAAAPPSADVPAPLSADIGVYSDYIARGLSYTSERTSLQGHVEYDWARGPYVGAVLDHYTSWAGSESIEIDAYGGLITHIDDVAIDTGMFSWIYPGHRFPVSHNLYNTLEAYVGISYKVVGVKAWYELTDYFGLNGDAARPNYGLPPNGSSQGSRYVEGNLAFPLPRGFTLNLHVGHQWIQRYDRLNYTDALIGVQKDLGRGFLLGAARTDTNAEPALYTDSRGINLARGKWLLYLKWSLLP
jgi:uncharacterized protein (TIGR02001 family)